MDTLVLWAVRGGWGLAAFHTLGDFQQGGEGTCYPPTAGAGDSWTFIPSCGYRMISDNSMKSC